VTVRIVFLFIFNSLVFVLAPSAMAADWSNTEVHLQLGSLRRPTFAGGGKEATAIVTIQHASSWKWGDNFFFIDFLDSKDEDDFNDTDVYGEVYSNFSLGKITGKEIGVGPIRDVGVLLGVNFGFDANVLKFQPGLRLSWNIPGFTFLNTDFRAYIDANQGISSGGAPKEDDAFMFDVSWAYPFKLGRYDFSIEGHIEYLTARYNELGNRNAWWVLAQPQFRWHVNRRVAIGVEWQVWLNKLGDKRTNENSPQALLVWKF
jgi:nucleoside-specific outer membrane channel protein Tsx